MDEMRGLETKRDPSNTFLSAGAPNDIAKTRDCPDDKYCGREFLLSVLVRHCRDSLTDPLTDHYRSTFP